MLNRTSPIDYQTKYVSEKTAQLWIIKKTIDLTLLNEVDIELVQRSFVGSEVTREQALAICIEQRKKTSHHAFFDFAVAMYESDPSKKQNYLLEIVKRQDESQKNIIGQAAYELAKCFFRSKKYIESQAWFIHAILLDNKVAIEKYKNGMADESRALFSVDEINASLTPGQAGSYAYSMLLYVSFLAITLSGKKLDNMSFDRYWLYDHIGVSFDPIADLLKNANQTTRINLSLEVYHDSFLGRLACNLVEWHPAIFWDFFLYCADNKIISPETHTVVLNFIVNYPESHPIDKNLILNAKTKLGLNLNPLRESQRNASAPMLPTQPLFAQATTSVTHIIPQFTQGFSLFPQQSQSSRVPLLNNEPKQPEPRLPVISMQTGRR